jgi:hypothetical protein
MTAIYDVREVDLGEEEGASAILRLPAGSGLCLLVVPPRWFRRELSWYPSPGMTDTWYVVNGVRRASTLSFVIARMRFLGRDSFKVVVVISQDGIKNIVYGVNQFQVDTLGFLDGDIGVR